MISNRCEHIGLAIENRNRVAAGNLGEQRKNFVSNAIANKRRIAITGIKERLDPFNFTDPFCFRSTQIQNRMTEARADRSQPVRACTAQQIHDHGFGPVVRGVTKGSIGPQHFVASGTSSGFEIGTRVHEH
jgi:hypothetical protein